MSGFRDRLPVAGLFCGIETLVGDANQLITLVAVLWVGGDSVVHADVNHKIERAKSFSEDDADTAAKTGGLKGISLRKEQCEFVTADAEGGVGSTKSFFESTGGSAENLITARVAMFVVYFLEAVEIESDKAKRVSIAARAVKLFVKVFVKESAVVKASQRIGDGVAMQVL